MSERRLREGSGPIGVPKDNRLLALLLVAAVLLCHGAFVSLHHPVPEPTGTGHPAHVAASADATPDAGDQLSVGTGHVAALLFMLGTALGLWLMGARRVREVRVVLPRVSRVLPTYHPDHPRAPALASLQVFRL